jgi:1,4-alpha-glucan branching enzyme
MRKKIATAGKKVRFEFRSDSGATVSVAGSFNGWDPERNPMKENSGSGLYVANLVLPKGRHEYKFVVNGDWQVDPNCSEWVPNGCGSLNSVMTVG